jgi:hypothetical protein
MKQKILGFTAALLLLLTPVAFTIPVSAAAAPCPQTGNSAKSEVLEGAGTTGASCDGEKEINNIFASAVKILSIIVGAVAVIMILFGGLKYITSSGDPSKVASAKNTILYAILGVIVAVLAQVIVNVTVNQTKSSKKAVPATTTTTKPAKPTSTNSSSTGSGGGEAESASGNNNQE